MRIKVVGYFNPEDIDDTTPSLFDADHESGLSEPGFMHFKGNVLDWLDDVTFEVVP